MDEPKSLDSLFKDKIFRIPYYQRGYAWQKSQLKDFWEDLIIYLTADHTPLKISSQHLCKGISETSSHLL
jgi:uncharacterized protein with ParB-like and HNH nuclease domain